jgi:soluble lytic murein transglycosylase-like protein
MALSDLLSFENQTATADGLNPTIFAWMFQQESGNNPNAVNGNAVGIAQMMPGTASDLGIDPTDPYQSISGAGTYLSKLLAKNNGNYTAALTQYGTLANVPASVTASYNKMLQSIGLTPTTATGTGTATGNSSATSPGAVAESDSFITKIAIVVLGIVLIGGAIMVYHKS